MDYDNDGNMDFISGSYDPGDLYWFRGLGDGQYEKVQKILDEDGQPLVHHPIEFGKYTKLAEESEANTDEATQFRVASFGSWPAAVDWDNDGDLDMLIGSFGGQVFLRENIGTRAEPKYSRISTLIETSNGPMKEVGHANPVVADWDADGLWDLVMGSSVGSVAWYRNEGTLGNPKFGSRQELVKAAAEQKFIAQNLAPGEDPVPGVRAQICVTDYDGDGWLDLIVGDYSDINWTKELSEEEEAEFEAIRKKQEEIGKPLQELQQVLYGADVDEEEKEVAQKKYREIVDELMELDKERKSYFAESRSASFVWFYRRTDAVKQTYARDESATSTSTSDGPEKSEDEEDTKQGPVNVSINASAVDEEDTFEVSVTFTIQPSWHLYASADSSSPSQPVEVEAKLPNGVTAIGEWMKPEGEFSPKTGAQIYTREVTFARKFKKEANSAQSMELLVSYQVCDEKSCLPPKKIQRQVTIQ